jgi:hypothetical protein
MAFISKADAAAFLGVEVSTLNSWRWNGRGPKYHRLSHKKVVYDEGALREFALSCAVAPSVRAFMEERRGTLQEA